MGAARPCQGVAVQGAYDLTVLDNMDGAFPPKRTSANIYRENGYDKADGDVRGAMDFGETRDSLDRLAVSTSDVDRQRLARIGSTSSHSSAVAPPPLLSPTKSESKQDNTGSEHNHRPHAPRAGEEAGTGGRRRRIREDLGGRWTGPTRETAAAQIGGACGEYDPATKRGAGDAFNGEGGRRPAAAATGDDALSHEMEQRSHVRGAVAEEHRPGQPRNGRDEQSGRRTAGKDGPVHGGGAEAAATRRFSGGATDENGDTHPAEPKDGIGRPEDAEFLASLRGGEGAEAGENRRRGGSRVGPGRQAARARHGRRREWNSDTGAAASLGSPRAAIVTDNSPSAVQGRIEASSARRRNTDGAVSSIADSPYAAGGGTIGGSNGTSANGVGNATWKHKHTKTLPWGDEGEALGGAGVVGGEDDGGRDLYGFGRPTATQIARKGVGEGRGGAPRSGYRTQMMPSPSTGNLTAAYQGGDDRFGGDDEGINPTVERSVPAEKEKLRRNLSLLKKKMHSQAGSRRSQSAGPRAGELFGYPNAAPSGPGGADSHLEGGGRQHLHMTTGTAPAMMPADPEAFLRDRDAAGRALGRRGVGGGARRRPPPDGPGSPYAIDPNPRGGGAAAAAAAARTSARQHQHRQPPLEQQNRQHRHQQQQHEASINPAGGRRHGPFEGKHDSPRTGFTNGRTAAPADVTRIRPHVHSGAGDVGGGGAGYTRRGTHVAAPARPSGGRARVCGAPGGQGSPDRRQAWEGENGGGGGGGSQGDGSRSRGGGGSRGKGGGGRGGRGEGYADDLPPDAFPDEQVELEECRTCGRRFTPAALEKHSRACHKVFQAKRKVFDTAEMRLKGTELEKFAKEKGRAGGRGGEGRGRGGRGPPRGYDDTPVGGAAARGARSSKWRQQSKQFRDALRQARVVGDAQKSGKSLADLPPPKPSAPDPSLIPCPHCGRRFSELAGERHMQHCKNIKAKPSVLKKGSGSLLGQAARKTASGASGKGRGQRW
ncbi:unnamed protein product [Ectocarpus sp. CCAP 1310/34]|nr:unnamed protein product [Ectocarpus sp. CCAP 1310/34]